MERNFSEGRNLFYLAPRLIAVSRVEAKKIGAITVMKQKLLRVSMVLGTGGVIAEAVLSGAQAASAATRQASSWHLMSVASIPGTAEALGGNATGVATTPVVYQYS